MGIINKRFRNSLGELKILVQKVHSVNAKSQVHYLRKKIIGGMSLRKASMRALKFSSAGGYIGCQIVLCGKIRCQRSKCIKLKSGPLKKIWKDGRSIQRMFNRYF